MRSYVNKYGKTYYLPDFGPPVRWLSHGSLKPSAADEMAPSWFYFECDKSNLGCRSIQLWRDGRVVLAYPGGPYGDTLPEGTVPSVAEMNESTEISAREITEAEFATLWRALSKIPE